MKKAISILLALVLCLSLCACGGNSETTNTKNDTNSGTFNSVIIADNEYVKIVATEKYEEKSPYYGNVMGYQISIENKTDKYINLVFSEGSIDGYMLDFQEGPFFGTDIISPGKKANTQLMFMVNNIKSVELKTLNDLVSVDGLLQISFSDDGNAYGNDVRVKLDNLLP